MTVKANYRWHANTWTLALQATVNHIIGMTPTNDDNNATIGFISALRYEAGWLGGLLILTPTGKPLEFHCTAHVKPTQSHQVLYGPTLDEFVLGDNITPKLIAAVKSQPIIYCVDCVEMMAAGATNKTAGTIVFVDRYDSDGDAMATTAADPEIHVYDEKTIETASLNDRQLRRLNSLDHFVVGQQKFAIDRSLADQRSELITKLTQFTREWDLTEPFERIHNAIQQSHGIRSQDAA